MVRYPAFDRFTTEDMLYDWDILDVNYERLQYAPDPERRKATTTFPVTVEQFQKGKGKGNGGAADSAGGGAAAAGPSGRINLKPKEAAADANAEKAGGKLPSPEKVITPGEEGYQPLYIHLQHKGLVVGPGAAQRVAELTNSGCLAAQKQDGSNTNSNSKPWGGGEGMEFSVSFVVMRSFCSGKRLGVSLASCSLCGGEGLGAYIWPAETGTVCVWEGSVSEEAGRGGERAAVCLNWMMFRLGAVRVFLGQSHLWWLLELAVQEGVAVDTKQAELTDEKGEGLERAQTREVDVILRALVYDNRLPVESWPDVVQLAVERYNRRLGRGNISPAEHRYELAALSVTTKYCTSPGPSVCPAVFAASATATETYSNARTHIPIRICDLKGFEDQAQHQAGREKELGKFEVYGVKESIPLDTVPPSAHHTAIPLIWRESDTLKLIFKSRLYTNGSPRFDRRSDIRISRLQRHNSPMGSPHCAVYRFCLSQI
uniref:Uncharacterized protein n=1 Tax=Chromera velia CCMP2878 TaxID=1169474 RepID=A0A0G4H739_9ALVE|eukprot:Cvel_24905.t1-p1 / transcript=Cvel_24905.t1 / gene=Cvel_24905 / organism=Chromera_velia_CCMP2878 / gene_product=hypothetical protein / transcript_product=hypothetical protein / location=Cvel_scaffold2754:6804-19736(+) / protein_length=485 / sequence_SO=supercontig / SO=protein_coding / is_pseudo=false